MTSPARTWNWNVGELALVAIAVILLIWMIHVW